MWAWSFCDGFRKNGERERERERQRERERDLFYAGSTFVCVGHANSTQQERFWSMKLILKWILCYLYHAFPCIPYFNQQNAPIKI